MDYIGKIKKSVDFINTLGCLEPRIGIILGSGLGGLGERIKNKITIEYRDIPYFPIPTVDGHRGQLIIGQLAGKNVVAMQGRFHHYEGYNLKDVVFPVRVMIGLGIDILLITNAAGGVEEDFNPGDLMIIRDHINITGYNPLRGNNLNALGPRFVDMSKAYDKRLISIAKDTGEEIGILLKEGTYMWFTGPSYETPAEIKLARTLGASAVGMSTVPEVIVAVHQGIRVLGLSCITNMAAGILDEPLNHAKVVKASIMVKDRFEQLIIGILGNIQTE